jgi:zinc/manganese transport system substrate-binding protein
VLAALSLVACATGAGSSTDDGRPVVVVSFPVLGAVVADAVGDAAEVRVLMPNGADPHDWSPSPKDIEAMNQADLVVVNGFDLEEGMADALADAERSGVPVFEAASTVEPVEATGGGHADETDGDEHDLDPHLWMNPRAMRSVVEGFAAAMAAEGVDIAVTANATAEALSALDREIETVLAAVPDDRRVLVTGHESMGWFALRYRFEVVGTIVPGLSSQAGVDAGVLAELTETIEAEGVPAIFTELGTPPQVAEAIGREAGVEVVELASHHLPDDGTYRSFLMGNAEAIAGALA